MQSNDSLFTSPTVLRATRAAAALLASVSLSAPHRPPRFSPGGKSIYFAAADDGTQNLCRIQSTGGEITLPFGGRLMVNNYALGKNGTIIGQVATSERPDEIYGIPSLQRYLAWYADFVKRDAASPRPVEKPTAGQSRQTNWADESCESRGPPFFFRLPRAPTRAILRRDEEVSCFDLDDSCWRCPS